MNCVLHSNCFSTHFSTLSHSQQVKTNGNQCKVCLEQSSGFYVNNVVNRKQHNVARGKGNSALVHSRVITLPGFEYNLKKNPSKNVLPKMCRITLIFSSGISLMMMVMLRSLLADCNVRELLSVYIHSSSSRFYWNAYLVNSLHFWLDRLVGNHEWNFYWDKGIELHRNSSENMDVLLRSLEKATLLDSFNSNPATGILL